MGIFFLFQALLNIASFVADLGLRAAVEKRISEGNNQSEILTTGIFIKAVPLVIIVSVVLMFKAQINAYIGAEVSMFLAAGIVFHEMARLLIKVLNGELQVEETAVLIAARHVVWIAVGCGLVFRGFAVEGIIYGYLLGYVVMIIWGTARVQTSFGNPSLSAARSLFAYAKFDAISGGGWRLYSWIDVVIIGFVLSQAAVGAYEIAWKVAGITMIFGGALRTSIFPQISKWYENGEMQNIEDLLSRTVAPSLYFVIPAFFGSLVLSQEILGTVFGTKFTEAWAVLIVFMVQKLLQGLNQIYGRTLQAIDRPDLAAYAMILGVVTNISLNIVLVMEFGMIGAAVATAASFAFMTSLRMYYLANHVKIIVPYSELGWFVVASLGMSAVLFAIKLLIVIDSVPEVIGTVAVGALVFGMLSLAHHSFRKNTMQFILNRAEYSS